MTATARRRTAAPTVSAEQSRRVYDALQKCAEKVGANNYLIQSAQHKGSPRRFRFHVTEAHRALVDAMGQLMSGEIDPEQAMSLVLREDIMIERFPSPDNRNPL